MTIIKIKTEETTREYIHNSDIPRDKIRNQVVKCARVACEDIKTPLSKVSAGLKKIKYEEVEKYYHTGHTIITVNHNENETYYIYK